MLLNTLPFILFCNFLDLDIQKYGLSNAFLQISNDHFTDRYILLRKLFLVIKHIYIKQKRCTTGWKFYKFTYLYSCSIESTF